MRRTPFSRRPRALAAAAGLTALLLASCGGGPEPVESFPGAPVVIISIDTLRSDRLPAYGYDAVETPAIDALRADSILFERAYSHYPLTLPSHSSLFTGRLPPEHGVRDNVGYRLETESMPFLPAILGQAGYATGGAVSTYVLRAETGIGDGFDFYDDRIEARRDVPLGGLQRGGDETLARATGWLDGVAEEPFFFFFHIYEPHSPYAPPEPYRSRYADRYDGEVAYSDAIVGRLLDRLRAAGAYDRSLIILLSDHGEGLSDHGEEEHGVFLYREAIQVPLMVKLPGGARAGSSVAASAQLVDVLPTVLSLLGLPIPEGGPGRSLIDLMQAPAERRIYSETFYPRLHMGWSELASVVDGRYHYIDGPDPELFDLVEDFGETRNLVGEERRRFADLRDAVAGLKTDLVKPAEVDPETVAKMAALGYTGAPVDTGDGPLPDPKSQLHVMEDLRVSSRHVGNKEWSKAIPVLERLVTENPRMQDSWEKLGLALHRVGRREEALAAYQQALDNSGGAAHVALTLSSLYTELGRLEEAREHAELAVAASPALARQRLAEIALTAEDFAEAEAQARAAIDSGEERAGPWVTLAQVLARTGRLEAGFDAVRRAEELMEAEGGPAPPGYHLARADLLARSGEATRAVAEFEREIAEYPENLDAYSRLAVLYVASGQGPQGVATLRRMVDENGRSPAAYASAVETLRILGDRASAAQLLAYALRLHPGDGRLAGLRDG